MSRNSGPVGNEYNLKKNRKIQKKFSFNVPMILQGLFFQIINVQFSKPM